VRGGLTIRLPREKTSCPKEMSQKEIRQGMKNVRRGFRTRIPRDPKWWTGDDALLRGKEVMT